MITKEKLIRLAKENPRLREKLVPLVKAAKEAAGKEAKGDKVKVLNENGREVWVTRETLRGPKGKNYKPLDKSKDKDKGDSEKPEGTSSRSLKDPKGGEHKVMSAGGGNTVFMGSYTSKHIKGHTKPGTGSVFSPDVDVDKITAAIANTPKSFFEGGGGLHTVKVPGAGRDLVKKVSDIKKRYPNAREVEIEKQEGVVMEDGPDGKPRPKRDKDGNVIPNMVKAKAFVLPDDDDGGDWTATDQVSIVMRPANPQFMPDEAKGDDQIKKSIDDKKGFAVLTAFPGNPDVPKTSEWGDDWAAIIPNGGKGTKWEQKGKTAINSLRSKIIRLAHEKPELRVKLLPLIKQADEGEEEAKAGPSKKPGGKFIQFMKERGDDKVRNPDTGNDVKLKSLKGDRGKKLQKEKFEKWLASQEKSKGKSDEKGKDKGKDKGPDKPSGGSAKARIQNGELGEGPWSEPQDRLDEKKVDAKVEQLKGSNANLKSTIRDLKSLSNKDEVESYDFDVPFAEVVWDGDYKQIFDMYKGFNYKELGEVAKRLESGMDKKASFRSQLIRLAHEKPELRKHLLPLLSKEAKTPDYRNYVDEKKRKGEKPLSKEDWETKVLGKGEGKSKRKRGPLGWMQRTTDMSDQEVSKFKETWNKNFDPKKTTNELLDILKKEEPEIHAKVDKAKKKSPSALRYVLQDFRKSESKPSGGSSESKPSGGSSESKSKSKPSGGSSAKPQHKGERDKALKGFFDGTDLSPNKKTVIIDEVNSHIEEARKLAPWRAIETDTGFTPHGLIKELKGNIAETIDKHMGKIDYDFNKLEPLVDKLFESAKKEPYNDPKAKPEKKPRENGELPIGDKGQQKRKQMSKAEKLKAYQEAIKNSKSMSPEDKKKALEKSKKPGFDADAALGAMGEEEEDGKQASLTKVAHRPYLTSEGLDSRKVNKGEGFMLYMIDQAKNHSKFYEGVMLDNGDGTYRVLLRWGALTDSGFTGRIDGAKFDGRMSALSEREAKAVLMKKYRDKTRKGYVDAFKHKLSKGQYPIGLKRDVGFGWGTQDAAFCIPALRRIRSLLSEASQSLTQMQFASASDSLDMASELAMRDLRSEDSSMAKKILDNITHMQDRASKLMAGDVDSSAIRNWKTALNRLMSYLDKQLSVCHTASRSTLTANDKLRYARLAASLPKGSAQRMAALQVLLGE